MGFGVEVNGGGLLAVNSSNVDGQLTVHEHPYVVVAFESELLSTFVRKTTANFGGEVKVVVAPLVADALFVDRKKLVVVVNEYAAPIAAVIAKPKF